MESLARLVRPVVPVEAVALGLGVVVLVLVFLEAYANSKCSSGNDQWTITEEKAVIWRLLAFYPDVATHGE